MKFIFSYLKKYRYLIHLTITIKFLGTLGELSLPYIFEYMIDEVAPSKSLNRALIWGGLMVVMAFLTRMLNIAANRRGSTLAKNVTYEMRQDLFFHSIHLSGSQMDAFGLPSIISRMTSDSYNIQNFIRAMMAVGIRGPILLIGGIGITMTMDAGMAMILLIIAPIVIFCVVYLSFKGIPLYDHVQKLLDKVVRIMRENITGILVVKALSKEEYEKKRFAQANHELTRSEQTASIVMSLPGPVMNFFLNIGLTLVVLAGAYRVNEGLTKPGVILAFLTYFNLIINGVMGLNRIFMLMSKANASASRIEAVVKAAKELKVIQKEDAAVTDRKAHIVFDHVSFRYTKSSTAGDHTVGNRISENQTNGKHAFDNKSYSKISAAEHSHSSEKRASEIHKFDGGEQQMNLTDIDFEIKRGGSLGIIGATGSGKTTIINLLMRFYDTSSGHIFIDGRDIRTYPLDELRKKFGVVFQNDAVFADTLAENICFGREISEINMRKAAADACAAEFIEDYDDTYQHQAAISGANLSGGQKQRLLISRALAARPDILILDDASSALDYRTDAALRRAIREQYQNSTTIVIAQRISSIMTMDHILMLKDGQILGYGTHEELLKECPAYRDIYEAQMGEGE